MSKTFKLAVVQSHPVQYFSPFFATLARSEEIDLTVYYCSRQGLNEYRDHQFRHAFKWDTDLLAGYKYKFLRPLLGDKGSGGPGSLINPEIAWELFQERYDAVFFHGYRFVTHSLAIATAKMLGAAVLMRGEAHLGLQGAAYPHSARRVFHTLLYKWICNACLPIGTLNRNYYIFHKVPENRLWLVPYAVDNDYFVRLAEQSRSQSAEMRASMGISDSDCVILYASKLMRRKRPHDLLRAFADCRKRGAKAALVIVGSGEEESEMRRIVSEHSIYPVHFAGFQNQSALPSFFAIADLFVLPSEAEPWGLIINEVMCAGLPVVAAADIGAVVDLVRHGENGLVYETGSVQALTNALEVLIDDPERRRRMGRRSRQIISQWDYHRGVEGVLGALRTCVRCK